MIELVLGTYGFVCWLVFKKWKLIPVNTYTVSTAIMVGVVILGFIFIFVQMFHPAASDARLYAFSTPIVPQVRGMVIEVPVQPNVPLRKGDLLFRIDPVPFQFEVDRLEATLAGANTGVAQLEERVQGAEASTKQAAAELLASESEYDRQAREALEQASANVAQVKSQVDHASTQEGRYRELVRTGVVSQAEYDRMKRQLESLTAQLKEAQAAERQAAAKLQAGGDKLRSVREQLRRTEAQEREARHALEAESGGMNPQVREIVAQLDHARWELEQTEVRAPADGYVTQLLLRPGQMAIPLVIGPVMVFIHADRPALVASFSQNVMANIKPRLEAEVMFRAYPGRVFKARVSHVLPAIAEGQLTPSGQLRSITPGKAPSRVAVVFDYGPEIAQLRLPVGAAGTAAIYTEHLHALSVLRKILLRIKSWESYVFLP